MSMTPNVEFKSLVNCQTGDLVFPVGLDGTTMALMAGWRSSDGQLIPGLVVLRDPTEKVPYWIECNEDAIKLVASLGRNYSIHLDLNENYHAGMGNLSLENGVIRVYETKRLMTVRSLSTGSPKALYNIDTGTFDDEPSSREHIVFGRWQICIPDGGHAQKSIYTHP